MSKDYQINYNVVLNDLTPGQIAKHIANMKRLAKAQLGIDKDRILNKQATYQTIALAKAAKKQQEFHKKQDLSELNGYRQLLAKKNALYKSDQLKRIRGDEQMLAGYLGRQQGLLSRIKTSSFTDPAGKSNNLNRQLDVMRRIHQAETMLGSAIIANTRKREAQLRVQERQAQAAQRQLERRAMGEVAIGAGAGLALRQGGRGMEYAFGKTMELEQLGIAMEAQFGDKEGKMVMGSMKKYSVDTMFKLKDTIQLLLDVKKGAGNIGLNSTEDMVAFTKKIGEPLLSFAVNQEKRAEAGYQLGQIFMAGTADERQDIKVIARAGIPIYAALTKMTGKNIKELKDIYGSQLPATLIAQAMLFLAESKENMAAMAKYEKSFTIAWQGSTEQLGYTSAAFGDKIAEALKIPSMLRLATKAMEGIEKSLIEGGGGFAFYLLAIAGISTGLLAAKALIWGMAYAMQIATGATIIGNGTLLTFGRLLWAIIPRFLMLSGIASGIYLIFSDWNSMFDSINKKGLIGVTDHLDKLISVLAVLGVGFATGGFLGLLLAAAGIGAVGIYKYLQYKGDVEAAELASFSESYAKAQLSTPSMSPWKSSPTFGQDTTMQKLFPKTEAAMTPIPTQVNVGLQTIVNAATGETKTTAKRDPSYIYNTYDKIYAFDGY